MVAGTGRGANGMGWIDRARSELAFARERTLGLVRPLPEEELLRQHSPLMSPLAWDLAHIANYEEQWLLRALGRPSVTGTEVDLLYDAFRHPRSGRAELPLFTPARALAYLDEVREQVLEDLARPAPRDGDGAPVDPRLLRGGFVFGMVAQHEQQHAETLCATLQLMRWPYRPEAPPSPRGPEGSDTVDQRLIPGGPFWMGSDVPWAYDNERPRHRRELPSFFIDAHPVTNRAFAAFIHDGGYDDARLWSQAGWAHRQAEALEAPLFWKREGRDFVRRRFGFIEPVPPDEPVQHVCWYEADAFARWRGCRLPTEAEWERAAAGPQGDAGAHPWGQAGVDASRANLGQRHFGPAGVGAYPDGETAEGVSGLLGDVWEWTASDFLPYPGFQAFPYREYSEVFHGGEYKVLRGGSWATAPVAIRNSFRNWDFPIRRQIFAGFRCARDA